jgi:hypothetical protein
MPVRQHEDSKEARRHDNPYKLVCAVEERVRDYLNGYYGPQALGEALRMLGTLRVALREKEADDAQAHSERNGTPQH